MIAIQVDDNGNSHRSLSSSDGNDENSKEQPVEFVGKQILIECDKIDVHAIQYQLLRVRKPYTPIKKRAQLTNNICGKPMLFIFCLFVFLISYRLCDICYYFRSICRFVIVVSFRFYSMWWYFYFNSYYNTTYHSCQQQHTHYLKW